MPSANSFNPGKSTGSHSSAGSTANDHSPPTSPPSPPGNYKKSSLSPPPPNKCPICLEEIENQSTALNCGHIFCYECISHWVQQRNRCPLCRQVIGRIRHKVTEESGQLIDREEEVPVPEEQQGFILNLGFITVVRTPMDSALYIVQVASLVGLHIAALYFSI